MIQHYIDLRITMLSYDLPGVFGDVLLCVLFSCVCYLFLVVFIRGLSLVFFVWFGFGRLRVVRGAQRAP